MSAEVTCPNCDWPLAVGPDAGDRHVTCWNCEHQFVLLAAADPGRPPAADEPPPVAPPVPRSLRPAAPWVIAAVAVVAAGALGVVARVNAQRAVEAERTVEQFRAEREAAVQFVRGTEDEVRARVRDAEAVSRTAEAIPAADPKPETARAAPPADDPGAIPRDIPADVRAAATATLRKVGEAAAPLFRKALADGRDELARLKNPFRPAKLPSKAARDAAVAACEKRIAAAETAVKAWDGNDLDFFAPNLTTPGNRGAVGRITSRQVRVARVLGRDAAVVEFLVGGPGYPTATAVVTGIDGGKFADGRSAEFPDVVVVAGSVTVDRDTYPRLAVFSASKKD